ncbi:DUF1475 family protein [bacterium]|nr:DUF1475 family protein [bacterium]
MKKNALRYSSLFGAGILIASCFWAGPKISIVKSFSKLWPDPWFKVTLLDLVLGFGVFSGFIMRRERSVFKSLFWVGLMGSLGNIATFVYLFIQTIPGKGHKDLWEVKREKWKLF